MKDSIRCHSVVSKTEPERSPFLWFASRPLCIPCTTARPDKRERADDQCQHAHCCQPLHAAAPSLWPWTLFMSFCFSMQRLDVPPPAFLPAADVSNCTHGMAPKPSCDILRFSAAMQCLSIAPARISQAQAWPSTAVYVDRAATSPDDSIVLRQTRQATTASSPHSLGALSITLKDWTMDGGKREYTLLYCVGLALAPLDARHFLRPPPALLR